MFNSISVKAAPVSGVITSGVITAGVFLRFDDPGASFDEWSEELSPQGASSISDIPRFVLVIRLLCEAAGEPRSRGAEVTFRGG